MKQRLGTALVMGAALGALVAVAGTCLAAPSMPAASWALAGDERDRLVLNTGQVIEGEVVSEDADSVRFRVMIAGISAETDYRRSDILKIERAAKTDEPKPAAATPAAVAVRDPDADRAPAGTQKVYFMELKGWFGTEIYPPPVREAVKDAKKYEPDYLVVIVNNAWERFGGLEKLKIDDHDFTSGLMLAREFDPILTDEIREEWDKQPKLVFWVKQALGGAAFLPFLSSNIYFHSQGKMGGIGGADVLFEGVGDEVVRDKMVSLYTATARGLAIKGGHDSRIARAMSEFEYVLSYAPGPVFFERYPEPGEFLLTDNGRLEREADTMEQRARGEGNDVLTLTAELALALRISQGTADDEATLLDEMGISRTAETTYGRSNEIFESWRGGVNSYGRKLTTLLRDLDDVQVEEPGGYNERQAARARQIKIIDDILRLIERYGAVVRYGLENPGVQGDHEGLALNLRLRRERLRIEGKLDDK